MKAVDREDSEQPMAEELDKMWHIKTFEIDQYGSKDVKPHLMVAYIATGHVSMLTEAHTNMALTTMRHTVQLSCGPH